MRARDTAAEARALLGRLASELGFDPERVAQFDCSSLARIAAELRAPAHMLRLIELDDRALGALALPALTLLDDQLALVRTVTGQRVLLELADGTPRTLSRRALVARCGGRGIEFMPTLSAGQRFVPGLLALLRGRPSELVTLGLLALSLAAGGVLVPLGTQLAIDRALPERAPNLLALVALGTLLVALSRALFGWLKERALLALHGRLEAAATLRLCDHLLRIPYPALVRETVGGWLETLRGAQRVQDLVGHGALMPLLELAMAFVYGIALAHQHLALTLALMVASLWLLALSLVFAQHASKLERALIDHSARQQETLHELIGGVLTLRTCGAVQRGVLRWLDRLLVVRGTAVRIDDLGALQRGVIGGTREAIGVATFVWCGHACLAGDFTVGALLSMALLGDRFVSVIAGFGAALPALLTARTHVPRIDALLAHEDVTTNRCAARELRTSSAHAVVLEDVWFRYGPDQPWVLKGHELHVPALEQYVLTGPSGMGKSTILRLIAGLYRPERGSVRVLGHAPGHVLGDIGYLPQQTHLFHGTIQENLRLLSGATMEELHAAAAQSGLSDFVLSLPMGYDTLLPEGATTLSGGQRQLIAWTAALASGRKVLLLDEALSQVDRLTRVRLMHMARARERTIVSVEHESVRARACSSVA